MCRASAEVFLWHEKSVRSYGAAPVTPRGRCEQCSLFVLKIKPLDHIDDQVGRVAADAWGLGSVTQLGVTRPTGGPKAVAEGWPLAGSNPGVEPAD